MAEHSLYHQTQLVIMNLPFPFLTMGHPGGESDSDMAAYINHLEFLMDGFDRLLYVFCGGCYSDYLEKPIGSFILVTKWHGCYKRFPFE